ncbi:MAG TPA: TetR/AcrR family transcriptional regulator [Acidobacteriaceae bacterium]|jgi:AcrR family transcriptional regulator
MPASPTARKIAAAARHLLDKEGADAVTMRRVADAVGITAMALYRHYADRAALLNALANEGFDELAHRLSTMRLAGDIEKRLMKILDVYLDHALENPRLFELMFLRPREGARQYPRDFEAGRSPTANLMAELIQQGMDSGYLRQDDLWEIVFEMGALLEGLVMLYLGGRMAISPARFRAFCRRSFWRYIHGIRN